MTKMNYIFNSFDPFKCLKEEVHAEVLVCVDQRGSRRWARSLSGVLARCSVAFCREQATLLPIYSSDRALHKST